MVVEPSSSCQSRDATRASRNMASVGIYRPPAARKRGSGIIQSQTTPSMNSMHPSMRPTPPMNVIVSNVMSTQNTVTSQSGNENNSSGIASDSLQFTSKHSRNSSTPSRQRERRPDRAVYVPRAKRNTINDGTDVDTNANSNLISQNRGSTDSFTREERVTENQENSDLFYNKRSDQILKSGVELFSLKNSPLLPRTHHGVLNNSATNLNSSNIRECEQQPVLYSKSESNCCVRPAVQTSVDEDENERQIHLNNDLNETNISDLYICNTSCDNKAIESTKCLIPEIYPNMTENLINCRMSINKADIIVEDEWDPKADKDVLELRRASEEINRSNRRIMKQSFVSDVLIISEPSNEEPPKKQEIKKTESIEKDDIRIEEPASKKRTSPLKTTTSKQIPTINPDEDDWDTMFDDNGDCLDPKLLEELTANVGQVYIEKPKSDYKAYQNKAQILLSNDEFPHVLEIYDFPSEFKTQDLLSVFAPFKSTGFEIRWVDDTHALGVFSSSRVAAEVLANTHPFVKTRPLREATIESRQKARRSAEFLQPYRERPKTCAALARRLVTGALGVRLKTATEEREKERQVLKEAKERKLLAARQRDEAWEDDKFAAN